MTGSVSRVVYLLLAAVIVTTTCSPEVVREVTIEREVIVVETVLVEKPIEIPVPQTVVVEKEVTVEVPVEREVKVVETVLVERPIEIPVTQTVVVEKEVTVEVPRTVVVERYVHEVVLETVIVEKIVTVVVGGDEGQDESVTAAVKAAPAMPEPTATATTVVVMPDQQQPSSDRSGQVNMAVRRVGAVNGLPTIGPYAGTPTSGGGVEEYFFHFENGDPMTPELVESWDIDPAGSRVRITMRQGPDGNDIPFNSPLGFEDTDFGIVNSDEVVRYFNESNANINPDTTYGNSGDLAAIF